MLKIGDFSTLTQVPVKTLRYYDEVGLLKPAQVDPVSGYRFYLASQLPRLHRILALKDLGFPLDEIARALEKQVGPEQLRGMLLLRQAEQRVRVEEEQMRLGRLEARLRLIEQENLMNADVVLKQVSPQWIASVRETIPNYQSVGKLYSQIFPALGRHAMGVIPVALWHDGEYKESDVDAEACLYLKKQIEVSSPRVKIYELPAVTAASIIHNGAYRRLSESYQALGRWIDTNGYRPAGPPREIYLKCAQPVSQDDESYVTEIQIPVERA